MVVGGGNSAGQAAVFLAGQVRKVYLVVRGDDLYKHMSSYLADADRGDAQYRGAPQHRGHGDVRRRLPRRGRAREQQDRRDADDPDPGAVQFHRGGAADRLAAGRDREGRKGIRPDRGRPWLDPPAGQRRSPFLLETSRPGVFAAGDVRSGSVKRVASAVGEGSMAVQFVHEFLKESAGGSPPVRTDPPPGRETQPRPAGASAEHR